MHKLLDHLKGRLPEIILLAAASAALFSTALYGFHTTDAVRTDTALIILWPAVLTVILMLLSYSPKTVSIGGVAYVAVAVIALAIYAAVSGVNPLSDSYDNAAFPFLLGFIIASVSHLCTRKRSLCLLFTIGGCLICAVIQFLYLNGLVIQTVVFLLAAGALCIYRVYRVRVNIVAKGDVTRPQAMLTGLVLIAVPLAIGCAIFFGVIAPLNPPAAELKLFTQEYALEEVHVSGDISVEHKTNKDLKSSNAEDAQDTTNKANKDTDKKNIDASMNGAAANAGNAKQDTGTSADGFGDPAGLLHYLFGSLWWLAPIVIVLLCIAFIIGGKLLLRKRRVNRIEALQPGKRMVAYQVFFDRRMAIIGRKRPEASTLLEYAHEHATDMAPFEANAPNQATYLQLAQEAAACSYGNAIPSEQACQVPRDLYSVFYKNLRKLVGLPKYLLLFFRI